MTTKHKIITGKRPSPPANKKTAAILQKEKGEQLAQLKSIRPSPPLPVLMQHAVQTPYAITPDEAAQLQQAVGNRALNRLPRIQAKLTLGPVDDKYEREADAVARQVVRRIAADEPAVQRQEEDEDELQMKPVSIVQRQEGDEDEELQMKPHSARGGGELSPGLEQEIQSAKGGGRPLPVHTKASMEQAFQADFSGVRIHTDGRSHQLNRSVRSRAFTTGQDIFFRQGEYSPERPAGQELLAHELTHVIQQNGSGRMQRAWAGRVQTRRRHFPQVQRKLVSSRPRTSAEIYVQRWSIGGWFSKKGHELITQESINEYNEHAREDQKISKKDVKDIKRGSRWNDMLGHKGIVTLGLAMQKSSSLAHQSHEGSLQFLHGMASSVAEEAWQTQHKIMLWAEFTYKVATGQLPVTTKLGDVRLSARIDFDGGNVSIASLFAPWKEKTIAWLFTGKKKGDAGKTKRMASGSMLHMLQDTFCASHTQRVASKNRLQTAPQIRGFNVYTEQSASIVGGLFNKFKNRHAIADALRNQDVSQTAGANEAMNVGARVLGYIQKGSSWRNVTAPYLWRVLELTPELERQKPKYHRDERRQKQPDGRRLTSASGRLFRKKWLSQEFKRNTSRRFKKRPSSLREIDAALAVYETLLKQELNTLTVQKPLESRKTELLAQKEAIETAHDLAQAVVVKGALGQKCLDAAQELVNKLLQDKKEVDLDIASVRDATR